MNCFALGDVSSTERLYKHPAVPYLDSHYTLINHSKDALDGDNFVVQKVEIKTLDEYYLANIFPKQVDIMVIDVEGWEERVLKGALQVIQHSKNLMLMLEVTHNKFDIFQLLTREDLIILGINQNFNRIIKQEDLISGNYLAMRNETYSNVKNIIVGNRN